MAARRLLVILIYFTCKTQTKAPDAPPEVSVFPSEISAEADSVTLYCYPPPSIIVSQCYFSIEEGQPIQSSTCWKTLTGTELLAKAGQSSLSEVKVKCFYKVRQGEEELQSSHSNPASIFIQGLPPKLTVHPRVISAETDTVTLYCQPPSSASCFFIIEGKSVASSSCQKTLTVTELLANKGQSSPAVVKVKCFYTVRRGEVYSPSLRSNTLSIQIQTSAPTLTVSAGTISETESVTLRCQTPPSVSAPQCYFYTVKGGSSKLLPCVETLTGSELLLMSQQSSPAEVEVKCFYTVKLGHVDYPSAHSDTQVMMIQSDPPELSAHHSPGEHVVFTCYLPGSVIKDTTCNLYFGDGTVQRSILSHRSRMDKKCFCQFYVSTNDLLRLSPQQSHASCDYSLKGDPNTLSPRSEQYNLADILESESARAPTQPSLTQTTSKTSSTVQVQWRTSSPTTSVKDILESKSTMVSTQPSLTETASKTSSPPTTSVRDNNIYKIIACVTCCGGAVGVILLGWLFMKKGRCFYKRTQGNVCIDFIDMEDVDFGGVGTAGKNQSNDALTPEPSAEYCADSKGVDKNIQDNEGEDHFYCAIADVPVKIIQTNMEYSLLQPH